MISGSRIESGTQILSARVRNTIQSIKEIVGNHSDADIYVALKETNMDPNETTQKLLNQDPFHEVRRKRDKKKENAGNKGSTEPRKYNEYVDQGMKLNTYSERHVRRGNSRNGIPGAGISREFRVVRDNRTTQNANREMKPASPQYSTFTDQQVVSHISEKGSRGAYSNQKLSGKSDSSHALDGPSVNTRKETSEERRTPAPSAISQGQPRKLNDSQSHSVALALSNSVVGVYSSSSDPVHVPSPDSRSAASVGAIKREIGVVGVRRQTSENSVKHTSQGGSFPNSQLPRDHPSSRESFRPFSAISKNDQTSQSNVPESIIPNMNVGRSFLSSQNQYNSRSNQQLVGHQKVTQPNKEWKPKSTQKSSVNGPGVIGMPSKSAQPPRVDNNRDLETEAAQLQDKPSRGKTFENQNVIIAEHIRVNETDRSRLTFGSFGPEFDSSRNSLSGSQAVGTSEESSAEPSTRLLASSPESSSDETSGNKHVDLPDGQVQYSGSISPASDSVAEHQLPDKMESSSPPNLDNFADIGLIQDHNPSYTRSDSQEQQEIPELPNFSTYDPQTGYDIPYFRPGTDEGVKGQGLPFAQEALSSHTTNIPGSTIAMVQQQQPPMAQMYPQVHVPHFANLMPYRQYLSPVYVPPMPMSGYSNNHPSYPHPPNGSSYLLMPGGGSHLSASNLKYGIQQFKPVPAGSPTGFGNFHSPTGYAVNAPGVVGSATGIEDSSRLKYKDGNLYIPNQQAETSEIWYQNPRDLPGMQSTASYYNMPTQTPHAAYLPSHTSHASFNAAAAAQSSHIQFPGLYHHAQPQPGPIASPHHMGPTMGGNVGVGVAAAAPGAQVGPYQQPQLGHLNWTPSF